MPGAPVTAAILAGGRATRLGGVMKPLLEIGGRRILDRQLDVLGPLVDEVILVANEAGPFASSGLRVVPDRRPGLGPLAGLEAALEATSHAEVLLVAGDLPFLDPRVIALLLDADAAADAVVPRTARGPEPLLARYARRIRPRASAALDADRRAMHRFLEEISTLRIEEPALRAIDPALGFLRNVNTPEDLFHAARGPH